MYSLKVDANHMNSKDEFSSRGILTAQRERGKDTAFTNCKGFGRCLEPYQNSQ